jgi:hypothetical protein
MASLLADAPGTADELIEIDFALDPASIPRFQLRRYRGGAASPPAEIEGKKLIIGGTAADMEDRYAVPRHGVLAGVVVQVLAAETLLAGGAPAKRADGGRCCSRCWPRAPPVSRARPGAAWRRSALASPLSSRCRSLPNIG